RRPDRDQDLQLDRNHLARQPHLRHAASVRVRLRRTVHDRRTLQDLPRRISRGLAGDGHVLRRRAHALRPLRRDRLRALLGPLLLVAEDVRPCARRAAGKGTLLAHLRRLQPHVLPAAHAGPARNAAPDLHLRPPRAVGGVQPDLLDRLRDPRPRRARLPRERRQDGARRPAGRQRPLARGHARVVHDLAAARLELRACPVRDERAAAARLAAAARGGAMRDAAAPGFWLRLTALAATGATLLAVVSGAAALGTAHRALAALALPPLVALVVAAWIAHRRLLAPSLAALILFGTAAIVMPRPLHIAFAALAFGASAWAAARSLEGAAASRASARDYVTLTKPRIMSLLLLTGAAGAFAGTHGRPSLAVVALTLGGLALACGGASALNHVLDRDIDRLMGARTRERPVAAARVPASRALEFGLALSAFSFVLLASLANVLAALLALAGNLFYVLVYTRWLKRSTPQHLVIGGAAGAVPPLVGYAVATGHLDLAALVLFGLVFLWTPPHFWA